MANTKISDLAAVTDVLGTDEYVLSRSGVSKKIDAADLLAGSSGLPESGWVDAGETWTYASADSPTFTFTVAADVTAKYSLGMRVKLTQTTEKYFIVTAVSTFSGGNTTITIYGGTDYTLANAAISSPFYSVVKAPFGFPLNPAKWTFTFTDSSRRTASGTTASTWYNPGSLSFDIPLGVWDFYYFAIGYVASGSSILSTQISMSTSASSESDTDLTCYAYGGAATESAQDAARRKTLVLTAKTTYRPVIWASATSIVGIAFLNDFKPLLVKAVCAYL